MCIVDFAEIMPFEWDTMVYLDYHSYSKKQNNVIEYINKLGGERKYSEEGIHFWKDGKLIHEVSLFIASDDEKGAIICTFDNLKIFRKDEAKFQVQKKEDFMVCVI